MKRSTFLLTPLAGLAFICVNESIAEGEISDL